MIMRHEMQVQKIRTPVKKPATAARALSTGRSATQSGSKDINSSLIQRAIDLVREGQLTAGVAIKLFGIPKSTFYKKLSLCSQQQQPASTPYVEEEQYYQACDFPTDLGTDDIGSCGRDSFVGTTGNVYQ